MVYSPCSVSVLQRSPFPAERALDSAVPRRQERFWAALFLQGSSSPVLGCLMCPWFICIRGRGAGHPQEGLEGICPGSAASTAAPWGKRCSLGLPSPRERDEEGVLRSLCSAFLLMKVLAAGETSQPLPRPAVPSPGGCGEGAGLVLKGLMQLLPFIASGEAFTDPTGKLGADRPQLPLLIPAPAACAGSPWEEGLGVGRDLCAVL